MSETLGTEPLDTQLTVDNQGIPCTLGIFKVMQAMERIEPGGILKILSTDRSSKRDLAKWANRVGHQILAIHEEGNVLRPSLRIYIRKKL